MSNLRHELRTPLNQIIGYSEMLQEEAEEKGQKSFVPDLQKIHGAARHLLTLINENLGSVAFRAGKTSRAGAADPKALVAPAHPAGKTRFAQPDHGKLLVVDDIAENRDMLSRRLEKQGYTVSVAENGLKALEAVRASEFDLVLLDIMMPEMDGYQTLEKLKSDRELKHIPVIMISALDEIESVVRCIQIGAEDYLPKPFDPVLLRARIGACLEKKRARDQEQLYYQALLETQKQLTAELAEAATYVKSVLPAPLKGEIGADWRFIPSTSLGGDSFGYHWLDSEHFAMYLLDVCGHGVGAALLSISVMNVLRSQSLPKTDFRNPGEVLGGLNDAFPMEKQNNMYFTIWYGVYNKSKREIVYASGGHPPAVLLSGPSADKAKVVQLRIPGMAVGSMPSVSYRSGTCKLEAFSKLYVFSDGVYEVSKTGGGMVKFDEFVQCLALPSSGGMPDLDRVLRYITGLHGASSFEDDVSIMRLVFD